MTRSLMSAKALRARTGGCRLLAELPQVVVDVPIAPVARFSAAHRPEEGMMRKRVRFLCAETLHQGFESCDVLGEVGWLRAPQLLIRFW